MKLQKEIEPFRATIEAIQRLLAKFDNHEGDCSSSKRFGRYSDNRGQKSQAGYRPHKQWVKSFAEALEMPSLWDDIAEMFKE